MKKHLALCALVMLMIAPVSAQVKVGYFDINYVMPLLPETEQVKKRLNNYAELIKGEMKAKEDELKKKADEFERNVSTWSENILKVKQEELQRLDRQLQEFQQKAQNDVQIKEQQEMQPVFEKVEKALQEVANANGYTHIFRSEFIQVPVKANNLSDVVLKKLGVSPPPPPKN